MGRAWSVTIDTAASRISSNGDAVPVEASSIVVPGRSVIVLQAPRSRGERAE